MHSKIFQVSMTPLDRDEWASPSSYYDHCDDFADYIGDADDEEERKDDIECLAKILGDFMELDGDTLVYKSESGLKKFMQEWVDAIKEAAQALTTDNMFKVEGMWRVRKLTRRTHKECYYRFKIEDWNGGLPDELDELVEYIKGQMKPGQRLYIGSVIDFHY